MFKRVFLIFFVVFTLNGCVETIVVGTVAAGAVILSDGSAFDLSQDSRLQTAIKKSLKNSEDKMQYKNVNVTTLNGKVLLTGYVEKNIYKSNATKIAKSIKENLEVINEIMVFNLDYKINGMSDSFISKQITMQLKGKKGIKSGNYEYDVVDGNVFIIGIAQNQDELKKVVDIASRVKGVKKVISYIVVVKN